VNMRVLPVLEGDSCDYTRLQALAWTAGGVTALRSVNDLVAKQVLNIVKRDDEKPLIVDCKGMGRVADHAFDLVRDQLLESRRPIMFLSAQSLKHAFEQGLGSPVATYSGESDLIVYGRNHIPTREQALEIARIATNLLPRYLNDVIGHSYRTFEQPKRLLSTPLIANGVFDARRIIANPEGFVWCSVALADIVERRISEWFEAATRSESPGIFRWVKDLRLLAVSLRSSPFAASVALLCGNGLENSIEIVDHVGPKHRILEEHRLGVVSSRGQYILISDFVIGGTELKIARSYAEMRGGSIRFVTALGSFLAPDSYGLALVPLVDLTKANPNASFRF
jgi:hypothetical protein